MHNITKAIIQKYIDVDENAKFLRTTKYKHPQTFYQLPTDDRIERATPRRKIQD